MSRREKPFLLRPMGLGRQAVCLLAALLSIAHLAAREQPADNQGLTPIPALRQADNVVIIPIRGEDGIDRVDVWSVQRRLRQAEQAGADAVVFDLDTPGGEIGAVLDLCSIIKGAKVRTIAWINPKAYSGGAIAALACDEIVVAPNAAMGDALPIAVTSFGRLNELSEDERHKFLDPLLIEVVDSARRKGHDELLVQGIVSRHVRLYLIRNTATDERLFVTPVQLQQLFGKPPPPDLLPRVVAASSGGPSESLDDPGRTAERGIDATQFIPATPFLADLTSSVSRGQSLASHRPRISELQATEWELVEYVSSGEGLIVLRHDDMLRYQVAASSIADEAELKAFFGAKHVRTLGVSWSERVVTFLINPWVKGVLVVVFLLGLFLEMTHPGVSLPGAVAATALVALIAPPALVDMAQWWEIAAIGLGIVLVALEIFVLPGFGIFGIAGLLLFFGGLVGTFAGAGSGGLFPDSPSDRRDLLHGTLVMVLSVSSAGVLLYFLSRHMGSVPVLGRLVLKDVTPSPVATSDDLIRAMDSPTVRVGDLGVAITSLRPSGRAQFGDSIVDVVAGLRLIDPGSRVRVTGVEGMRIVVEEHREA